MVKEVVKRDPTRIKMFFKHLREKNCHLRFALLEKKLALHPLPFLSLIFPISLPFANFLLVISIPCSNRNHIFCSLTATIHFSQD